MSEFIRVEDLVVYQKLCDLHIEVRDLTQKWPAEEKYELSSKRAAHRIAHQRNWLKNIATDMYETRSKE